MAKIIENDDLNTFKLCQITLREMETLRFEYDMNLIQLVCHEEAVFILEHLVKVLEHEPGLKKRMVDYRDAHLGSQAIHLAAATGNH